MPSGISFKILQQKNKKVGIDETSKENNDSC